MTMTSCAAQWSAVYWQSETEPVNTFTDQVQFVIGNAKRTLYSLRCAVVVGPCCAAAEAAKL
jgi:hypothetical protein